MAAAKRSPGTGARAHLLAAFRLVVDGDHAGAERELDQGLLAAPHDPRLLEAKLAELLERDAPTGELVVIADRLRRRARTAEQSCELGQVELRRGNAAAARALIARGLRIDRTSSLCRRFDPDRTLPPPRP